MRVEELCAFGATCEEVAHFIDVSHDTLERACKKEYGRSWTEQYEIWYYSRFRLSLRRRMHEKAMKGDTALLIFLGKNHLGMSDMPQQQSTAPVTVQYSFENFFAAPPQGAPQLAPQQQQSFLLPHAVPVEPIAVQSAPLESVPQSTTDNDKATAIHAKQ